MPLLLKLCCLSPPESSEPFSPIILFHFSGIFRQIHHNVQVTSILIIAAIFWSEICKGSYILVTTRRNMKNVNTFISPFMRSELPTTATVPIPSFNIICAEHHTKAAFANSEKIVCFSTAIIVFIRSERSFFQKMKVVFS